MCFIEILFMFINFYTIVLFKVEEAVAVLQAHQAKQAAQVKKE